MTLKLTELFQKLRQSGFATKDFTERLAKSSGPGGQNVNKVQTCVHITHLPSGITVRCQSQRTQPANRLRAWQLIFQKLLTHKQKIAQQHRDKLEKFRRRTRPKPASLKRQFQKIKIRRKLIKTNRAAVKDSD